MDKILEGLVSSSHPLPLKRVIVRKVVESAEHGLDEAQCEAMFDLTTRLILEGEDPFQRQVGHQVLEAYARYHRPEFESFFNKTFVLGLLQQGYHSLDRKDVAILDYIHNGLKLIMSCPSVLDLFSLLQVEVLRMVCERPEPLLCARLSDLLTDFVQCIPKGKLSITFCQQLVRTIGHFQCVSTQEKELREYVSQVTKVSNLLQNIWKAEPSTLLPSLQEVFASISSTDASFEPSVALASLVQHIPLQMITVLIRSLTTDPNVKDASMTQALCRMIDWLSWPLAQHVDTWVIALLKGLAAVQKFTILIDVTLLKIELVFNRLWFPLVRPGALAVLSHMLLSFQHSPEAFHLIVPHVVNLVHSFKNDGLPSSTAFLVQLTELIQCMMYHYSGFPDLYEPILDAIKDFPKPSEEKIKLILNQSAWTSQSNSLASCLSRLSGKSETGKTGLINLGNTCYMNSVIQALFMATDFRRQVLSLNLNGCNSLMKKLQHLFAFLAHTQREAYAPRIFFEASRPPWFTPRSQQDCSEYLRFLLDRLHEEEKILKVQSSHKPSENLGCSETSLQDIASKAAVPTETPCTSDGEKTLIEKMFGGKLRTHICCLNCRSTSQKVEAFTDLSLAFCPSSSVENLSFQDPSSSPSIQDGLMQASILDPSEEPIVYNPAAAAFVCDSVVNEQTITSPSDEFHFTENTSVPTEPNKILINKDVPQKPGGENTPSVTDLLNYFLAPEILTGDNQYYCENCASLQNAEKTMQITEEPEYLILTLLRFSYDQKYHVRRKILDNISLPLVLELPVKRTTFSSLSESWSVDVDFTDISENLAKKLKSSGTEEVCCPKLVPYLLSSVVVHSGVSSESGHYYSYARNITGTESSYQMCHQSETLALTSSQSHLLGGESPSAIIEQDLENKEMSKEWFLFNDSRVTFTSFQSVQKITSRFPKDTAYVLLYKKQNSTNGLSDDNPSSGLWVNGDPPLQKELMDAITKDNKLYLQEQELNARARALQAASASCSFRPNGFDDNDPPGSCGPTGGGGGGGFNTVGRLVF
ncbi:ubiquitin carboxyl-terminal hydrolase 38 [Tupaia chinensis]|uniref:ubiquitin carboxyl-terminal hydrolase 38 n=1 Tax=Tupaia chinensis TaxID=246437 RepID=UPI0003C90A93|nr:ubiquitin carboxyl-terminal hydrolase 38 [Tupaia chinensis]XP_027621910.1 ubiquitin carboxyl-terminal hydrolase 38 [Tupaia chinensis]XP_027621914.1 ubiquitin carboxyl-terminal hydrolase 38 [Tupaia chinensis]XP_027621922.1 ubiquitin carboxyl-terminal hydrolase 38 [Tupaia chinensis]XP_027621925.1 ubiquitin carboxyl-terminal hydrolase 38 [Tupaia chinensis]XP_027621927.1 ubiquitin carboxyl-terminal hydrolase 38 [Tupaia chinensis]XP_027621928.1 ubiquitin carboxyl-terminal hydrolase 38 [Tupaia c